MVSFYSQGGLGNQLFQYAAAREVASKRNAELYVDLSWYKNLPLGVTPRKFDLFDLFSDLREIPNHARRPLGLLRSRLGRILGRISTHKLIRESSFDYSHQLEQASGSSHLVGYWQSEKYFTDISETLRNEIVCQSSKFCSPDLLGYTNLPDTVSIHVRRGDYVTNSRAAAHHGTCGPKYYENAINLISGQTPTQNYIVFSDEIDWAKENLRLPEATIYINSTPQTPPIRDMILMSQCKHNIIANSSFSWWGAWLGKPDRIVVAPRVWFTSDRETPDLIPKKWIKL